MIVPMRRSDCHLCLDVCLHRAAPLANLIDVYSPWRDGKTSDGVNLTDYSFSRSFAVTNSLTRV